MCPGGEYILCKRCAHYAEEKRREQSIVFYSNYMSRSRIEEDTTFIMDKKV